MILTDERDHSEWVCGRGTGLMHRLRDQNHTELRVPLTGSPSREDQQAVLRAR